ncbi:MAG: histone deacetylase [Spirochaetaceae bacterium]|nr:MAG: histone deacetylase [Spirochaetaceae bacterium]
MLQLHLFTDQLCRLHSPGMGHPERPERLDAVTAVFDTCDGKPGVTIDPGRDATDAEITAVHTAALLERVRDSQQREIAVFDADTVANSHSCAAALRAAGSACAAVDALFSGQAQRAFVGTRPPGHHAEADRPMGFCFFNNAAIAAEHARRHHGVSRIAIVDWDVHHGNGTMHSFYADPGVLYVSLHQFPLFPGSGRLEETGSAEGTGYTLNLPLAGGRSDNEYLFLFDTLVVPLLDRYQPQLVLISAGFDAHERDPLGSMLLSDAAFAAMTERLTGVAERHAEGRVAALLEGGYSLYGLQLGIAATIDGLRGAQRAAPADARQSATATGGSHTIVDSAVEQIAERAADTLSRQWGRFTV